MRLSDRTTGIAIAVVGAAAAYGGSRLPNVPGQPVGPNVFPLVVGLSLLACGAMIALGIGSRFEREAEAELAAHTDQPPAEGEPFRRGPAALLVLLPPVALVFYALVVERLGFFLTAGAMVLATALAFGARLRLALPLALGVPVVIHLIFYKLLRVPLPAGLVPMPW